MELRFSRNNPSIYPDIISYTALTIMTLLVKEVQGVHAGDITSHDQTDYPIMLQFF